MKPDEYPFENGQGFNIFLDPTFPDLIKKPEDAPFLMLNSVRAYVSKDEVHPNEWTLKLVNVTPIVYEGEEADVFTHTFIEAYTKADRLRSERESKEIWEKNRARLDDVYLALAAAPELDPWDSNYSEGVDKYLEDILKWRNNFLSITQPTEAERHTDIFRTADDVFYKWAEFRDRHAKLFLEDDKKGGRVGYV